jgi:hypothetical protein
MSLDIEILTSTLLDAMQDTLQQGLDTTCLPSFDSYYVDHLNVDAGTVSITTAGAAQFTFPVDVFVVDMPSLLANVNGTPPGALTPIGTAQIILSLTISGTTLTLACTGAPLGPTITAAIGAANAALVSAKIQAQIGTIGSASLGVIFSSLGIPPPTTSTIAQSGGSLFVRFDPAGSPTDTLQSGQDWCVFIDAATVQALVATKVNTALAAITRITSHTTTSVWAPEGTAPHINVTITGKVTVPDPLDGDFEMDMGVDFQISSALSKSGEVWSLVELITWVWNASTGFFVGNNIETGIVESVFLKTGFGGTIVGPNEFSFTQSLPTLSLGNLTFDYSAPVGLSNGMVLGGKTSALVAPDTNPLGISVSPFGSEVGIYHFCQGGQAAATLANVFANAEASFTDLGKMCAVTILSPKPSPVNLSSYLFISPAPGAAAENGSIEISFNGIVSKSLAKNGQPVELLVQMSRGVRVVNFGVPPNPKVDSKGDVENYGVTEINNCPSAVDPWYQVFGTFNPLWNVDPPESWVDSVDQVAVFQSTLINVVGVETGELVTFNQAIDGGLSVVTANVAGVAVIPALLAVRSVNENAALTRANRAALGDVGTAGAIFQRVAMLQTPGAISHQLEGDASSATVTTTFANGATQVISVSDLGVVQLSAAQVGASAGAQAALKPAVGAAQARAIAGASAPAAAESAEALRRWPIQIPGLVKILSVPGLPDASVAVAQLSDGTNLVLSREPDGRVRVAGLVPRWLDMPQVQGRWAISSAVGNRVAVFAVRPFGSQKCCCGCHAPADSARR